MIANDHHLFEFAGAVVRYEGPVMHYQLVLKERGGNYISVDEGRCAITSAASACKRPFTGDCVTDLLDMSMHRALFGVEKKA